jgi:hypothetical protein
MPENAFSPVQPEQEAQNVPDTTSSDRPVTANPEMYRQATGQNPPDTATGDTRFADTGRTVSKDAPVTAPDARPMPVQPVPQAVDSDNPDAFTHYAWLADGRVLRVNLAGHTDTLGSRYYEKDGEGDDAVETSVQIVAVYAR